MPQSNDGQCSVCGSFVIGTEYSYSEAHGYRCMRHPAKYDELRRIAKDLIVAAEQGKIIEKRRDELRNHIVDLHRAYVVEADRLTSQGVLPRDSYDSLKWADGQGDVVG